jgi:hypothetical protein
VFVLRPFVVRITALRFSLESRIDDRTGSRSCFGLIFLYFLFAQFLLSSRPPYSFEAHSNTQRRAHFFFVFSYSEKYKQNAAVFQSVLIR